MLAAFGPALVIIVGFGLATFLRTIPLFNEQINNVGAALINSLSIEARRYFDDLRNARDHAEARELQKKCEADLQKILLLGPEKEIVGAFDVLNIFFVPSESVESDFQKKYGVVWVLREEKERAYTLSVFGDNPANYVTWVGGKPVPTGIQISEGVIETARAHLSMRARFFEKPVYDDDKKQVCTVYLILSAQRIWWGQMQVLLGTFIAFLISAAVGIVASFALARRITTPITDLVKDFQIVSSGNLEHHAYSRVSNEIGYLARSFNEMTARLRAAHQAELEYKTREHEMKVATAIQASLLPKAIPKIAGYDIASFYRSSREVGGDYYDFIKVSDNALGIVVADVSGKGIPASMVMTMTRSVMRFAAVRNQSPAEILREVNHTISGDLREGTFVTALFALLHLDKKDLVVSSAGHNPLLYLKASSGECVPVKPKGIALGLDKGSIFDAVIGEDVLHLAQGDKIFMYTDGIIEARNAQGEQFGKQRLTDILLNSQGYDSETTMKAVVDSVSYHTGTAAQFDDIAATLLSVM
jgi:serine phosphatase RsbU (regulator of sigma subunit)